MLLCVSNERQLQGPGHIVLPSAGKFLPLNRKATKIFQYEVSSLQPVCVVK